MVTSSRRYQSWVSRHCEAFSLLEFIGVLGIIAIIAAALVPAVIKRIDRAAWVKENANLAAFSDAFTQYTLKNNTIPGDQGWANAVAGELGLSVGDVTNNSRRYGRAFLVDASGWLSTNLNTASGWSQGPSGATNAPGSARFMIVSSLGGSLTNKFFQVGGSRQSAAAFSNIWNTAQGAKPADPLFSTYKGSGEDIVIQRINIEPLFHRIILVNNDIGSSPQFGIGSPSPATTVTNGGGWNSYYLDGSVLCLLGTNGTQTAQEVIRKDVSRVFELGYWRDELDVGVHTNGFDFGTIAALFFQSPGLPNSKWGVKPTGIANALCAFMYGYAAWANQTLNGTNFCFGYDASVGNPNKTAEYALILNALGCFTLQSGGARVAPYP
jgi:type II secretory pathway pseudopilin PulG